MVHAKYFPFSDCWSLFPVTLVPWFFGFGWVHSHHSRFAFQMEITWKASNELLVFTEKADKLFFPKPYLLGLLSSCMIFPKFREKKSALCPRAPLCIWALLHKVLHKHVLTWSLAGVLTCFSVTGFVFAFQVQLWETAVECCTVVLVLGLPLCLLDEMLRIVLGAWEILRRGWM